MTNRRYWKMEQGGYTPVSQKEGARYGQLEISSNGLQLVRGPCEQQVAPPLSQPLYHLEEQRRVNLLQYKTESKMDKHMRLHGHNEIMLIEIVSAKWCDHQLSMEQRFWNVRMIDLKIIIILKVMPLVSVLCWISGRYPELAQIGLNPRQIPLKDGNNKCFTDFMPIYR